MTSFRRWGAWKCVPRCREVELIAGSGGVVSQLYLRSAGIWGRSFRPLPSFRFKVLPVPPSSNRVNPGREMYHNMMHAQTELEDEELPCLLDFVVWSSCLNERSPPARGWLRHHLSGKRCRFCYR